MKEGRNQFQFLGGRRKYEKNRSPRRAVGLRLLSATSVWWNTRKRLLEQFYWGSIFLGAWPPQATPGMKIGTMRGWALNVEDVTRISSISNDILESCSSPFLRQLSALPLNTFFCCLSYFQLSENLLSVFLFIWDLYSNEALWNTSSTLHSAFVVGQMVCFCDYFKD